MDNLTLELSLKPFKKTDEDYIESVCRKIFDDWKKLIEKYDTISFLLWTADGSELLDYKGILDEEFSYAKYIGGANNREEDHSADDPQATGLHSTCYLYMENPPIVTYRILKLVVSNFKKVGKQLFPHKNIRVGTTFDPGPEFAKSDFKYSRHEEICTGADMGNKSFVCSYAKLKADNVSYAGFPDGIPEGTPVGTFLGRQANIFMTDMGFDYIWFSNGFGFGREPWSPTGAIFDGNKFDITELDSIRDEVIDFWTLFRNECPCFPIETRGTNMSLGIDYATDGVSLKAIYDGKFGILPPPNSPWAAINGDFGLELMGYMSRIANLPDNKYLFRYYLHDIWWVNTPWYDRYGTYAHDIYMPLSVSRIDESGNVCSPTNMNILSIDNSFGDMPECCVNETIPHFLKALKETPDSPSCFVWVYPFNEYSVASGEYELSSMYFEDWFIRGAINYGLPLNTVVSTDNFAKHNKSIYQNSIIVTPVPHRTSSFDKELIKYIKDGGKCIIYGNVENASCELLEIIGVETVSKGASGKLSVTIDGKNSGTVLHNSLISGGDISTKDKHGYTFAYADLFSIATHNKNVIWLRGTSSNEIKKGQQMLIPHDSKKYYCGESIITHAMKKLGYSIEFEKKQNENTPILMLHKYNNAFVFSVYSPATTVKTKLKFPYGAPIIDGYDTYIKDGYSTYTFPRAERKECRVFVEQEDGIVTCKEQSPVSAEYRRRIKISGLKNATVRFFAESYCKNDLYIVLNPTSHFYAVGDPIEYEYKRNGNETYVEVKNATGTLVFSMPYKDGTVFPHIKN